MQNVHLPMNSVYDALSLTYFRVQKPHVLLKHTQRPFSASFLKISKESAEQTYLETKKDAEVPRGTVVKAVKYLLVLRLVLGRRRLTRSR